MKEPKTKQMLPFFDKIMDGKCRRVLMLGESRGASGEMGNPHVNLVKSLRNIPKKEFAQVPQINGYELARCQDLDRLGYGVG